MRDLNDLFYFVKVVDHGGFAPAGRALSIPKSKLSRRIAQLEARLGVRLLQRSTRHFSVTEIGQDFYAHAKAMLVEAEAAEEAIELSRSEPCGVVRITCPVALLDANVSPMLSRFMQLYPRVELHLEATNRVVDPVGEAVDIALRVRPPPLEDSDLSVRIMGDSRQCLLASPDLLKTIGTPKVLADLSRYPSLNLGTPQSDHAWNLRGPEGAEASIKHQPKLITRDMVTLRDAAVAGIGIVQLPVMMVREELASGALVSLMPGWEPRREIIHAVFPTRRGLLPSVRALIDHLVAEFSKIDNP